MVRDQKNVCRKAGIALLVLTSMWVITERVETARAQSSSNPAPVSDSELIAQFRRVEVASVSDAIEQIIGQEDVHEPSHAADLRVEVRWIRADRATQER